MELRFITLYIALRPAREIAFQERAQIATYFSLHRLIRPNGFQVCKDKITRAYNQEKNK
jgi:hypothetical protein